jgi:hypothetical protein
MESFFRRFEMRGMVAFAGFFLAGALATGAIAAPDQAPSGQSNQVVGVTDGGLAASSLTAREYRIAASRLKEKSPDAINDPARLINLGNAYAGMGRYAKARETYMAARYAPDMMLVLADGSEASSRAIAGRALSRLGTSLAVR